MGRKTKSPEKMRGEKSEVSKDHSSTLSNVERYINRFSPFSDSRKAKQQPTESLETHFRSMKLETQGAFFDQREYDLVEEGKRLKRQEKLLDQRKEELLRESNQLDEKRTELVERYARHKDRATKFQTWSTRLDKQHASLMAQERAIKGASFSSTGSEYEALPAELRALVTERKRLNHNGVILTNFRPPWQETPLDRLGNADVLGEYNRAGHYSNESTQYDRLERDLRENWESSYKTFWVDAEKQTELLSKRWSKYNSEYAQYTEKYNQEKQELGRYHADKDEHTKNLNNHEVAFQAYIQHEERHAQEAQKYNQEVYNYNPDRQKYNQEVDDYKKASQGSRSVKDNKRKKR